MSVEYLFNIFPVLEAGIDHQHHVEKGNYGNSQVDGHVFADVSIGEYIVPVHGFRQYQKAPSERCEMSRQTVGLRQIGQRTHLQATE